MCCFYFVLDEGKRASSKVASSSDASADDVRVFFEDFELFFEFESDDGLM